VTGRPVTLVTGASAGIGVEFARACAARGDALVLVARRRDRLEALAAELEASVHVIAADLSRAGAAQSVMDQVAAEGLAVATLINNAGFGGGGPFAAQSLDRQREMIDLNVRTLVELTHLAVGPMLERGSGSILNVASTAAFQPGPGSAVYFATKAFVLSFTEAIHEELKGRGIKVSALCPGATATEFGIVAGYKGKTLERFTADAAAVVEAGLIGLDRNRAIVVPGLGNKAGTQMSRLLPRATMRRLIARLRF
jgi:short-subunit dehydrogenase